MPLALRQLGVALLASLALHAQALTLNGVARYSELKTDYYLAGLYLQNPAREAEAILADTGTKQLVIKVTAPSWSPRRFSSQWTRALLINNDPGDLERFSEAVIRFSNLLEAPLTTGDTLRIERDSQGSTRILLNDSTRMRVERAGFTELLLRCWIGERPPSSDFKQAILGLSPNATDLASFDSLQPAPDRGNLVQRWENASNEVAPASVAVAAPIASAPDSAPAPAAAPPAQPAVDVATTSPASAPEVDKASPSEVAMPATELPEDGGLAAEEQDALRNLYRSMAIRRILQEVVYPSYALKKRQQGEVILDITVARDGRIIQVTEAQTSRYGLLNDSARRAVESAGQLPPVPVALEGEEITVSVPFRYVLK